MSTRIVRLIAVGALLLGTIAVAVPAAMAGAVPAASWVANFGASTEVGDGVAAAPDGSVYLGGLFLGTVDFDPDPVGTFPLTSAGDADGYVAKFDADGDFEWAVHFGGTGHDAVVEVAVAADGVVAATGRFTGNADFETGAGISAMTSSGSTDGFVVGLDPDGVLVWKHQFGATGGDTGSAVAFDASGRAFVAGSIAAGAFTEAFIAAYDGGVVAWSHQIGTTASATATGVAVSGEVVVFGGYFTGEGDFDPGAGTADATADSVDAFTLVLDTAAGFGDVIVQGGSDSQYVHAVAIDGSGNILTTGITHGVDQDFDPGPGVVELDAAGSSDAYVSKVDQNGDLVWVVLLSGAMDEWANGVAVDSAGSVFVTGYFSGTADFDPSGATLTLTSAGGQEAFLVELSPAGALEWAGQFGAAGHDRGEGVAIGPEDSLLAAGYFEGTSDFDPGAGTLSASAVAGTDAYLVKFPESCHGATATIVGTAGPDILTGTAGADVIVGLGGDDSIETGGGADLVCGGTGDDSIQSTGGAVLDGQAGSDTAGYGGSASGVTASLLTDSATASGGIDALVSIENLAGSSHADTLTGDSGPNVLDGRDGNDTLEGKEGNDWVRGGGGDDDLRGGIGNDDVEGGDGADLIEGGRGHDDIVGGPAVAADDDDEIYGGKGDDLIHAGDGSDVVNGKGGDDEIHGEGGDDTIDGGSGKDSIFGGDDADTIRGQRGDDLLDGEGGVDSVDGNAGIDTCTAETALHCEL